jgi:hypothetical protein
VILEEKTWSLLYHDIKKLDNTKVYMAVIYTLQRFIMYLEGLHSVVAPTTEKDYLQATAKKIENTYILENLGQQKAEYKRFSRLMDFYRVRLAQNKDTTVAFKTVYKRTDTKYVKAVCVPTNPSDQEILDKNFRALRHLDSRASQVDATFILCKFIAYRLHQDK